MIKNVTKYESRVAALTSDLVVPKPLLLVCKEEVVNLESVWKSRKKKKRAPAKLFFGGTDGNEDSSKNQAPEPRSKRAQLPLLLARKLKSVT